MYGRILFISILFVYTLPRAQTVIQWQKSLGGSYDEIANAVRQTSDGGYIVAGSSASNDGQVSNHHGNTDTADFWVVKLDAVGNIQWQKSLGGSDDDEAFDIMQTKDGGYIVAGYTNSSDGQVTGFIVGHPNFWIVKLDGAGDISWQWSLGGYEEENAYSIEQTTDGGYIVAGTSSSYDGHYVTGHHGLDRNNDCWILKLDTAGIIQWQQSLGGSKDDGAQCIRQTQDGGYIIAGYTMSDDGDVSGYHGGFTDAWVVKLDTAGYIQWQKCLGGSDADWASSVRQTTDGGFIVAATTGSIDGNVSGHHNYAGLTDYWLVKLDANGDILWQKCLGGMNQDDASDVFQTDDGGYIMIGRTASNDSDVSGNHALGGGGFNYWVVKTDTGGNIEWQSCLGGSDNEEGISIQQTNDGAYIAAGFSFSNDGNVSGNHGNNDFWVVKFAPLTNIVPVNAEDRISVYPNPAGSTISIFSPLPFTHVRLTNLLGQVIIQKDLLGDKEILDVSWLQPGLYFINNMKLVKE